MIVKKMTLVGGPTLLDGQEPDELVVQLDPADDFPSLEIFVSLRKGDPAEIRLPTHTEYTKHRGWIDSTINTLLAEHENSVIDAESARQDAAV